VRPAPLPAAMSASSSASTREQVEREAFEEQKSRERIANTESSLRAAGRETRTAAGRQIFRSAATPVARALEDLLAENLQNPVAGVGHAALDLVVRFPHPNYAAVTALRVVVDRISGARPYTALAIQIGQAMESELKGEGLVHAAPQLTTSIKRRYGPKTVLKERVAARVAPAHHHEPWSSRGHAQAGALMLQIMERLGLITTMVATTGHKRPRMVVPSPQVIALAEEVCDQFWTPSRGPMVVLPVEWSGLTGGGHLSGGRLVRDRSCEVQELHNRFDGQALERFTGIANIQQGVPLWVDPEMVRLATQAWENGGLGLFKVDREPSLPPAPPQDAPPEVWAAWKRAAAAHHADLKANVGRRVRIARGLRELGELAGREIYQAHWFDGRGRLYTRNRHASTQGQDFEKGCIAFSRSFPPLGGADLSPLAEEARRRHCSFSHSLSWFGGLDNPLDHLELWRDAKDPWQFLQAARVFGRRSIGFVRNTPGRLDQTCSGCGIIAALTRDRWLAKETNLIGDEVQDLYTTLARLLEEHLTEVLHTAQGGTRQYRWAEMFLRHGITRAMVKPVILALPYGGQRLGMVGAFEDHLSAVMGWQDPAVYVDRVSKPSAWLAKQFAAILKEHMGSALAFRRWARDLVRAVIPATESAICWQSPSGWPMRLGSTRTSETVVRTEFFGVARLMTLQEEDPGAELSALATAGSAAANIVHGIDAAVVHLAVQRVKSPMLTNHDCFAVPWTDAGELREELLRAFRDATECAVPEMLAQIEEQCRSAVPGFKGLPPFPLAGDPWAPGELAQNPAMYG
jgi:DNA-directed RNA polymerase